MNEYIAYPFNVQATQKNITGNDDVDNKHHPPTVPNFSTGTPLESVRVGTGG